jgi:general secretion pathway protein A
MYFEYFQFKEAPFNLTPNSRFFYEGNKHKEALNSLLYAINQRKGFIVITGEIGSGKTTVSRALINKLNKNTEVALITNTHLNGKDLLMTLLEDLEIEFQPGFSKAKLHSRLNDYLLAQAHRGQNVVLIIDEAQNLKPAVLEEVRMLSNLETETEKLIQIVLIGQPELKQKLALSRLEQLRQRVSIYFHLSPLSFEEMQEYILHRLCVASQSNREYFTTGALRSVYEFSKGVPRLVNQICDFALLTGFVDGVKTIDEQIMKEVIVESPMQQLSIEKHPKEVSVL